MIRVSVVIPVYNVEAWLPACLESVLSQTLEDIEVLCVNDASTDGSADILAGYARQDARLRVIEFERNRGQGIARNAGFDAARGEYVYFLDSDDMIVPAALERLAARADADALDGIFFDSQVVYDSPALAKRYASYPRAHMGTYPSGVMRGIDLFEAFVTQRDWTCYVQRQFWRCSYLREQGIRFPTWPSHEDEAFAFEALAAAERVAFMPEPLFIRRYRVGSVMTTKPQVKNFASYFQALCAMTRFACERGLHLPAVDRNIARIYAALVRQHALLLADGVDVKSRFVGTELLGEYLVFAAGQSAWMHFGMLSHRVLERVHSAKRVYVYGAGVLANDIYEALVLDDCVIEGFLVSSGEGNPSAMKGHWVRALQDVPLDEDAIVIVAVTDGYRAEIEQLLDEAGWRHVYCKEGWHGRE